jgi:excisionase family DNA binding protein
MIGPSAIRPAITSRIKDLRGTPQELAELAPALPYKRTGGLHVSIPHGVSTVGNEPRLGRSVSIDQAAQLLNVSRRTIYNRIRDGRLQTIRTLGGSQRVLVESLYDLGFRPQPFSTSASAVTFAVRPVRS